MAQITLAWTMTKVTAPIVGTTSLKHLEGVIGQFRSYFCVASSQL
jgi:aryl-alcohol dehydrogenase-like predicted oxidoreductase